MNFTFLGFDKPINEQWRREETKDGKCMLTLAPDVVVPIPDIHAGVADFYGSPTVKEDMAFYNGVIPFYAVLDFYENPNASPLAILDLLSGEWNNLVEQRNLEFKCFRNFCQLSMFVEQTLSNHRITKLEAHTVKLQMQCAKFQAIFDQVAERSDIFREFVKECESVCKK